MSSEGTPLHGDRGAWNVMDFDTEHGKDIDDSTLRRHLPLPGAAAGYARSDGTDWQRVSGIALVDLQDYSAGFLIVGGAADWEAMPFDWDTLSAAAGADMVHGHTSDAEGGTLTLACLPDLATTYLKLDASNDPVTGDLTLTPTANSITTLDVNQSDGTAVLDVDTTNRRITVTSGTTGQSTIEAGLIVNNASGGGAIDDFQVNSDTLTAILVDASADTLAIGVDTTFSGDAIFGRATGLNVITVPDDLADALHLSDAGGLEYWRIVSTDVQPVFEFNPGEVDIDFIVNANGMADVIFVRGSDGNIGLFTNAPSEAVTVERNQNAGTIVLNDNPNAGASASARFVTRNDANTETVLAVYSAAFGVGGLGGYSVLFSTSDLLVGAGTAGSTGINAGLRFMTGGYAVATQTRMIIDKDGLVGIDTLAPAATVAIGGNSVAGIAGVLYEYAYYNDRPNASSSVGFKSETAYRVTTTRANYVIGAQIAAHKYNIPAGVTNTGYNRALLMEAFVNDVNFAGTMAALTALHLRVGIHAAAGAGARTVTNAYGLYIENLYNAGTITNNYGLYQSAAAAKNYFAGRVGVGKTGPLAQIHVDQVSTTAGIPVLVLDQGDVSEPFTDYIGTSAASAANSLSSWTAGNAIQGHVQIDINGVKRWLRFYDDPTS